MVRLIFLFKKKKVAGFWPRSVYFVAASAGQLSSSFVFGNVFGVQLLAADKNDATPPGAAERLARHFIDCLSKFYFIYFLSLFFNS